MKNLTLLTVAIIATAGTFYCGYQLGYHTGYDSCLNDLAKGVLTVTNGLLELFK